MWLILTIIFAVVAYILAVATESLLLPILFLAGALVFMGLTWKKRNGRK